MPYHPRAGVLTGPPARIARRVRSWLIAGLLAVPATAQCVDPAVPAGGFEVVELLDLPVTYADGAVTGVDVRFPRAVPGPCGFPVVLVVHGLGADRRQFAIMASYLATRGYLTAAYDVRGQGVATVNPSALGGQLVGEPERLDVVEIVRYLASTFGPFGVADISRLGITGLSQGAAHSWAAAAYSGRQLPANARGIARFPVFKAAYPVILSPYGPGQIVPQGKAFSMPWMAVRTIPGALVLEPGFEGRLRGAMAAEDYAGVARIWANDPWRQDLALLASSTVPVMAHVQWNDVWTPVDETLRALAAMPASTPTRALLSAVLGHFEPCNQRQLEETLYGAHRWFDRFLRGVQNQIELEPRFVSGMVAETAAAYARTNTLLWQRHSQSWPPAGNTPVRYYLRRARVLDLAPPVGSEPDDVVRHRVTAGVSMAALVAAGGDETLVTQWFSFDSKRYDSAVLASDLEIAGSPRVDLAVRSSAPDFQLHCALYQVHTSGVERYLQSGVGLVRGQPGSQRLIVDFHDIHARILAGERVRLRIENLSRRFPAGQPTGFTYHTAPYFTNVDVRIEHSLGRQSWFELPVVPIVRPALTTKTLFSDILNPSDVVLHLDATPRAAGQVYLLLFGASGMVPGITLPGGGRAWLNPDWMTWLFDPVSNPGLVPAGFGILDAAGRATPDPRVTLSVLPLPRSLVGMRMLALGVVTSANGLLVSDPVHWVMQ